MATLTASIDDALTKDFESVGQLILRVKDARSQINRLSGDIYDGSEPVRGDQEIVAVSKSILGTPCDYKFGGSS